MTHVMPSGTQPLKATKEVKCRQKAAFPVFLPVAVSNSYWEFQCKQERDCIDFHMFSETSEPHRHP